MERKTREKIKRKKKVEEISHDEREEERRIECYVFSECIYIYIYIYMLAIREAKPIPCCCRCRAVSL